MGLPIHNRSYALVIPFLFFSSSYLELILLLMEYKSC